MNLSEKSVDKTLNFSLLNLCVWLFSRQRRKFPRMSLFHTSTLGVTLHYKQTHPEGAWCSYTSGLEPIMLHLGLDWAEKIYRTGGSLNRGWRFICFHFGKHFTLEIIVVEFIVKHGLKFRLGDVKQDSNCCEDFLAVWGL